MGVIGGPLGYKILRRMSMTDAHRSLDASAYLGKSKLATLLGQNIWDEIAGKVVIDFGCGEGSEAIEMAKRGARKVIGLDIQERFLDVGRGRAKTAGVSTACVFMSKTNERADVITAIDSFEHFDDPSTILATMHNLLKPTGYVLAAFGPT